MKKKKRKKEETNLTSKTTSLLSIAKRCRMSDLQHYTLQSNQVRYATLREDFIAYVLQLRKAKHNNLLATEIDYLQDIRKIYDPQEAAVNVTSDFPTLEGKVVALNELGRA